VDALLGGFRFHSGQKTADFMNEYNQEVYDVIHAAKESNKMSFGEKEKSEQIILTRRTLLDLNIIDRCEITIATSIIPRNFELQRAAIDSWLNLGFKVISLNSAAEAAIVRQNFTDIPIKIVNRTAEATTGKPYIFFDDVIAALSAEQAAVCGVVNSDIHLLADAGFADFVSNAASDGFLFGSRIDIDSLENLDGEKFIYGFDFFFFNKDVLQLYPQTCFCLGAPWWDYWAPFVPLLQGVPCKELISPVAFHVKHETKWAGKLFHDYGNMFANKVSQFTEHSDFDCKITIASSPEQLAVFSFEVLQYILNKSDKVVYPCSDEGHIRIEVGRLQYLAMRGQVIEHYKRIWELYEQIKTGNNVSSLCASEVEALHASLSWRLTRPLRWLGDKLRS
jgi:hypothetical protein